MPTAPAYLAIAEPCSEDWAQMIPTACGRFCPACQKEVLDFSALAPADILAVLRSRPAGSVCGRIPTDTLAESQRLAERAANRAWAMPAWLRRLPALLGLPLLLPAPTTAAPASPAAAIQPVLAAGAPAAVRLRIYDPGTGQGLGFAVVELWRADELLRTTQTEADGTLRLPLPADTAALHLRVQASGFAPAEHYQLTPGALMAIALQPGTTALPQVEVVGQLEVRETSRVSTGSISTIVCEPLPSRLGQAVVSSPRRAYGWLRRAWRSWRGQDSY